MTLFDKPFRYVPQADPPDTVSGAHVAVVDSVAVAASVSPAAPIDQRVVNTPAIGSPVVPAPKAALEEPVVVAPPKAAVEEPVVVDPPKAAVEEPVVAAPPKAAVEEPEVVDSPKAAVEEPVVVVPPEAAVEEPVVVDSPKAVVEEPVVVDSPKAVVADPVVSAPVTIEPANVDAPVIQPAVELVAREERVLRPAGEGGGLTVFARVVPSEPHPQNPRDTQRLVNAIEDAEPVLDQLRSLAASLHQARTGRELKVIAVTSSVSGEGKTLLAANLALTLSRSYMRQVLLIDADLRRPSLHRLFGIPSQEGIRTALESVRAGTPVAVQEVAPRLALLPAGKPVRDPISVLASDAMHQLMTAATNNFDWVIVDTPPVGMLPDVGLLSSLSDAVLLVVEAGGVRYDLVQRTVEAIGADRIFGVVLNKVPEHEIVASYGMHYYAPYR